MAGGLLGGFLVSSRKNCKAAVLDNLHLSSANGSKHDQNLSSRFHHCSGRCWLHVCHHSLPSQSASPNESGRMPTTPRVFFQHHDYACLFCARSKWNTTMAWPWRLCVCCRCLQGLAGGHRSQTGPKYSYIHTYIHIYIYIWYPPPNVHIF